VLGKATKVLGDRVPEGFTIICFRVSDHLEHAMIVEEGIAHFSQKTREMGHPAQYAKEWGTHYIGQAAKSKAWATRLIRSTGPTSRNRW
jgi:hypothetical protein